MMRNNPVGDKNFEDLLSRAAKEVSGEDKVLGNSYFRSPSDPESFFVSDNDKVRIKCTSGSVILGINHGRSLKISGLYESPILSDGHIDVVMNVGEIYLPDRISLLSLDIKIGFGSVSGKIIHPGKIEIGSGSVSLTLAEPLELRVRNNGSTSVTGMERSGNLYFPPEKTLGELYIKAEDSSISINYERD